MPKFTDQQPRWATENDLNGPWNGGPKGVFFRCHLCGYKFKLGDYWRWIYTNDTEAPGNPIVCQNCDGTKEDIVKKLSEMQKEAESKYWWFTTRIEKNHKEEIKDLYRQISDLTSDIKYYQNELRQK
jgi:hypothetical protein